MPTIKEMILSEDYADYILPIYPQFLEDYREFGAQLFNNYYGMIHGRLPSSDIRDYFANGLFYNTIPNLYSLLAVSYTHLFRTGFTSTIPTTLNPRFSTCT